MIRKLIQFYVLSTYIKREQSEHGTSKGSCSPSIRSMKYFPEQRQRNEISSSSSESVSKSSKSTTSPCGRFLDTPILSSYSALFLLSESVLMRWKISLYKFDC